MSLVMDLLLIVGAPIFGCMAVPHLFEKLDAFLKSRKTANL